MIYMKDMLNNLYRKVFRKECEELTNVVEAIKEDNDKIETLNEVLDILQDVCPTEYKYIQDRKKIYVAERDRHKFIHTKDIKKAKKLGLCNHSL